MNHFKGLFSSIFLLFAFATAVHAQCPEDNSLNYSTQFDLDTFALNYPNCTILRSIILDQDAGDPIIDLNAFNNIDTLESFLNIEDQTELISLEGLNSLQTCGNLRIERNNKLENLNGLESLQTVGTLEIRDCPELSNTLGLENLRKSGGRFEIENNASLTDLGSFAVLDTINFNFIIRNNPNLTQINGFNSLKTVSNSVFIISNNAELRTITGFNALEYIDEEFVLSGLELRGIDGFNNLITLNEDFVFSNTTALEIIAGFSNLQNAKSIEIEYNQQLIQAPQFENCQFVEGQILITNNPALQALDMFTSLDTAASNVFIQNNASLEFIRGFEALNEVGFDLKITDNVSVESIPEFQNLISVRDLDIIKNDELSLITGFSSLTRVVNLEVAQNPSLITIIDFPSLELVTGTFKVEQNEILQNFPELNALEKIVGHLWIQDNDQIQFISTAGVLDTVNIVYLVGNDNLIAVTGFPNLKYAGRFDISSNMKLNQIPDFNQLDYVDNYIAIHDNPALPEILGFNNVQTINANGIQISSNALLTTVSGFQNLMNAREILFLDNPILSAISGFEELVELRSELDIKNNPLLTALPAFSSLERMGSYEVINNDALITIPGFEKLEYVRGWVYIEENQLLSELPTFANLDTIFFGELKLKSNTSLNQISGFPNLKYAETVEISSNSSLAEINGFPEVSHVGDESKDNPAFGSSGLYIENNMELISVSGFEKLDSIRGTCQLNFNSQLINLPRFSSLTEIYGSFELIDNDSLIEFSGFENLQTVGRSYVMTGNTNLETLPNNRKLRFIGENLDLRDGKFTSLINFVGLEKLGAFTNIFNTQLISLDGLDHIDPIDRFAVNVTFNPMLSDCALTSLCDFITLYPERCNISENAEGCNSCEELDCENNSVTGFVYYDFNMNKVKDENESFIDNIPIKLSPDNTTALTRVDGRYYFLCEEGVSYTLEPDLNNEWIFTTDSSSYNFVFEKGLPENHLKSFGIFPTQEESDIYIHLISEPTRCNIEVDFNLDIKNIGTFSENGNVTLCLDPKTEFIKSFPIPNEIDGDCITWDFENFDPYNLKNYEITLMMPDETNTGEPLHFEASIENEFGFTTTYAYTPEVICSYDPNDKLVMPSGFTAENFIKQEDELIYTIRFQNDGNAEAINIVIEDTLSQFLDLNSFRIRSSSFPVYTYMNENDVAFQFDNIWLPSSMLDESGSQGYVSFSIKPKPGLEPFTEIKNDAFIYFDFNAAIQTNETINTIEGIDNVIEILTDKLLIRPNPANNNFCVQLEEGKGEGILSIYDLNGNMLKSVDSNCMESASFDDGFYLIKYAIEEKQYLTKLLIHH